MIVSAHDIIIIAIIIIAITIIDRMHRVLQNIRLSYVVYEYEWVYMLYEYEGYE